MSRNPTKDSLAEDRSLPMGAWAGLGVSALLMTAAATVAIAVAMGAFGSAPPSHAAPVAKTGTDCATWPLCPAQSPTASDAPHVSQQPLLAADAPITDPMPYDGTLTATLSGDWNVVPGAAEGVEHFRSLTRGCDLTTGYTPADGSAGMSDQDATEAVLANVFDSYAGDPKMKDAARNRLPNVWIPVNGTTARVEFEGERIDYSMDVPNTVATFSTVVFSRALPQKNETVYAELDCDTFSPGNLPSGVVQQTTQALEFQER